MTFLIVDIRLKADRDGASARTRKPEALVTARERAKLRRVTSELVLVQGNAFIKELLRSKSLPIGSTKADFEKSLDEAIESGSLTLADVEGWLARVEGWGDHHAYLFEIAKSALSGLLTNRRLLSSRIKAAGLTAAVEKPQPFAFPDRLAATSVRTSGSELEVTWHQGTRAWQRDRSRDFEDERDGDRFRFDAFRFRPERSSVRLVARADVGLVGMFVAMPLGSEHDDARNAAQAAAEAIFGPSALRRVNVGRAQLRLDRGAAGVSASRSRMRAQGGYVEFGATTRDGDFNDVEDIREVRLAARGTLNGESADFSFAADGAAASRSVRVSLNANDSRIYIRAQLAAEEEWAILQRITVR